MLPIFIGFARWLEKKLNNLTRTELAAWNADFKRYFDAEERAEKRSVTIDDLVGYKIQEALNDETTFRTLHENYEVVDLGQVMRALRSLDFAIIRFNKMYVSAMMNLAELGGENYKERVTEMENSRVPIDAVFTALSNIQQSFKAAIEHEAETEVDERDE